MKTYSADGTTKRRHIIIDVDGTRIDWCRLRLVTSIRMTDLDNLKGPIVLRDRLGEGDECALAMNDGTKLIRLRASRPRLDWRNFRLSTWIETKEPGRRWDAPLCLAAGDSIDFAFPIAA